MPTMPIYQRVRKYMDTRDVSRKVVAMNMGITESKLSLMLSGKRRLTVEEYVDLCKAIAVNPAMFFADNA